MRNVDPKSDFAEATHHGHEQRASGHFFILSSYLVKKKCCMKKGEFSTTSQYLIHTTFPQALINNIDSACPCVCVCARACTCGHLDLLFRFIILLEEKWQKNHSNATIPDPGRMI